jgi:transcriptional regulator with XRE-family HTH domain
MTDDAARLVRTLKQQREAKHLSQRQLAARAEVHENTIVLLEGGANVRFATVVRVARELGLRVVVSS